MPSSLLDHSLIFSLSPSSSSGIAATTQYDFQYCWPMCTTCATGCCSKGETQHHPHLGRRSRCAYGVAEAHAIAQAAYGRRRDSVPESLLVYLWFNPPSLSRLIEWKQHHCHLLSGSGQYPHWQDVTQHECHGYCRSVW